MSTGLPQSTFTHGELAPNLHGRVDFDGYFKGLRTCRNFIVQKYGGVINRPGTRFVTEVHDSTKKVRIIPFQFSNQQTYVLELSDLTMRVVANGTLVTDAAEYTVTGYNPSGGGGWVQLEVPGHPYVNGDDVNVVGVSAAINGIQTVQVVGVDTILLVGTYGGTWTGGGTVQKVGTAIPVLVTTPWSENDIFNLKFTQSADIITVCHPLYPTQQISRYSQTDWRVTPFVFTNGPFQDINVDDSITVYASNVTGSVTVTSSKDLFTADMVGLLFYIQQSPDNNTKSWEVAKSITINDIRKYGPNYYQAEKSGTTGTVAPTVITGSEIDGSNPAAVLWQYLHSGFGIVVITAFTDAKNVTATVQSRLPNSVVSGAALVAIDNVTVGDASISLPVQITTHVPHGISTGNQVIVTGVGGATDANGTFTATVIDSTNFYEDDNFGGDGYTSGGTANRTAVVAPTYTWALAAYGSAQKYAGTTSYYQQRQIFGGSFGQPQNLWMSRTKGFRDFGVGMPILDDDAITVKVFSNKINVVKHLLELSKLIVFTSGGPWVMDGGQQGGGVVTPATVVMKINSYALFVQEKGNQVRTLGYSFSEDAFVGQDVTIMSNHLLRFNTIVDWAYQETPDSVVWVVRDDGSLLGLTFLPEQQVTAWHRHDTDGKVESVCCVPEGIEDAVYFVVNRTIGDTTKRYIERFANRSFLDQKEAFFVDCGLSYHGEPATTFSGIDHLEGKTVAILADGFVLTPQVVASGAVTIDDPASIVHIGLPITADIETLNIAVHGQNIRDKKKIINAVSCVVDQTSGIKVGPDVDHLDEPKELIQNFDVAPALTSGIIDISIQATWTKDGRVFIRQDKPLPCNILSITPEVEVAGF